MTRSEAAMDAYMALMEPLEAPTGVLDRINLPLPPPFESKEDYLEWNIAIKRILGAYGILHRIESDRESLLGADSRGKLWRSEDMVCSLIYSACSPAVRKEFRYDCASAAFLWNSIERKYGPMGIQRRQSAYEEWAISDLAGSGSALEFVNAANTLHETFEKALDPPSEDAACFFLLGRLQHLFPKWVEKQIRLYRDTPQGQRITMAKVRADFSEYYRSKKEAGSNKRAREMDE